MTWLAVAGRSGLGGRRLLSVLLRLAWLRLALAWLRLALAWLRLAGLRLMLRPRLRLRPP
jgi:hypothetical protein